MSGRAGTIVVRDPHGRRWPVAALVAATGRPMPLLAQAAGYTKRSGHRWAAQGWVDDVIADQLACAAGLVPMLVWPLWCAGAVDEPDRVLGVVDDQAGPDGPDDLPPAAAQRPARLGLVAA